MDYSNSHMKDEEHGFQIGHVDPATSSNSGESTRISRLQRLWRKLTIIEANGVQPVPVEERNDHRAFNIFTVWFTLSTNLLP